MDSHTEKYRCIGRGFCGSIWSSNPDSLEAIKREDGGSGRSVSNDLTMHKRVLATLDHYTPTSPISIPACHTLIQPDNTAWWNARNAHFPDTYSPCRTLITERIPAMPLPVRQLLIERYCPSGLTSFVSSNPADEDCLVRPYLGRRRLTRPLTSRFARFSLRNYALHVDQVEELGLYASQYARAMAEALAMMHWVARVDANDVEFVLAPPRKGEEKCFQSQVIGDHCLWILDFDRCRDMALSEEGIEQACAAFFRNDPYYPRPGRGNDEDRRLWAVFRERFLEVSRGIFGKGNGDVRFAEMLMDKIEQRAEQLERKKDAIGREE